MITPTHQPRSISLTIHVIIAYVVTVLLFLVMQKPLIEACVVAVMLTPFVAIGWVTLGIAEALEALINIRTIKDAVGYAIGFFAIIGAFLVIGGIHDMSWRPFVAGLVSCAVAYGLESLYPKA